MIIVVESARAFKRFVSQTSLNDFARQMVIRMVLAFMLHRGRMSCSSAAGVVACQSIHRGQLTRFLARPRWQIELFFKELKSTLGVGQYQFERFEAVEAWMNCAITAVLFLEHERAKRLKDRRLSEDRRRWWTAQRLHGLCEAFRQDCVEGELKYLSDRLKTPGGLKKMKTLILNALPTEFRANS